MLIWSRYDHTIWAVLGYILQFRIDFLMSGSTSTLDSRNLSPNVVQHSALPASAQNYMGNFTSQHTEETTWQPFGTQHFQTNFLVWKLLYFDSNLTENYSQKSSYERPNTGLDNGLVQSRCQAIIWTNDGLIHCCRIPLIFAFVIIAGYSNSAYSWLACLCKKVLVYAT